MSSFTKNHPFIYSFYCVICVLPFVLSLPVNPKDDPFDKFLEFLSSYNCSMPKEVELPFSVTDSVPFSYLSSPLKECKTSEAVKENSEANLLCREVFDVIQNITCIDYKLNNSKIDSGALSTDVCQDFAAIQDVIPKQDNFLSRKFGDGIICKVMCTGRYESLCKTLLWGYNTQAKLKNATLEKTIAVDAEKNVESHPDSNEIPDEEITSDLEKPKKALNKSTSADNAVSSTEPTTPVADKIAKNESSLPATEDKKIEPENHEKTGTTDPHRTGSENTDKSIKASKVITIQPTAEAASKSSHDLSEQSKNIESQQNQSVKSDQDQNISTDDKSNYPEENNIEQPSKSLRKNDNDKVSVPTIGVNISAPDAKGNEKVDVDTAVQGEDNKVDVTGNKEKTENVPDPTVAKPQEENDSYGQENVKQVESKEAQADLNSKSEDPKENEIPNGESDSNAAEPTSPSLFPDKSEDFEPQPELKDPEQYNDSENDGDYAKQEYDTAFNPALKKESNVKNTLSDGSSQFSSGSNMKISNENYLGHESDINRNFLPARNYLPDQEDSHFFFYFLTIVLVLMAGYLIFHNKQKIIALIVEGRHERRRRSHGAGYKKLETK